MKLIKTISIFLISLTLVACATQAVNNFGAFQATPINTHSDSATYSLKTDNLLVIADASSSTAGVYQGAGFSAQTSATKFEVSNELLRRMNQTIPDDTGLNAGIRSFGFGPCTSWGFTRLNAAVSNYSTGAFGSGLDSLTCSSGGSPMHRALLAASDDLTATTGNIAVLIISAGHQLDSSPIPAAKALKAQYGDRLCIYTIWLGNEESKAGRHLMQTLANIGSCGFATSADEIAASAAMANYVERVLFDKTAIAPTGSPLDSDGDGVPDYQDKCPTTPKGAKVNKDGCWAYHGVFFDFDKATIKAEYHDLFENAVHVMNINPTLKVEIEGHTDAKGSDAYNMELSERRARAVKAFMVKKGVNAERMMAKGFGKSQPIADNTTEEGRAYNRRVEYEIISQ